MILNGVLHVTGEHDTGKTTFALECGASPDRICFFDDDIKGRATVNDLLAGGVKFGAYHDLVSLNAGRTMLEFHKAYLALIDKIQPGQFDAIVWDTWTRFANTCRVYVKANPNEFRAPNEWAPSGRIKGAEQNKEGTLYEARMVSRLAQLAPTVILATHLKDDYLNDAKTGKLIPAHGETLNRVPRMRIWLRQNPSGRPVPIGLFLKRFDRKEVTPEGLRTICVVPRKITPLVCERSLWETIWRYWANPVGDRPPTADETPDEFELSILDGTLSKDQKRTFQLMLRSGLIKAEPNEEAVAPAAESAGMFTPPQSVGDQVRALAAEGKGAPEIAQALGKPLPVVMAELSKAQ